MDVSHFDQTRSAVNGDLTLVVHRAATNNIQEGMARAKRLIFAAHLGLITAVMLTALCAQHA